MLPPALRTTLPGSGFRDILSHPKPWKHPSKGVAVNHNLEEQLAPPRPLFDEHQISERVKALGREICERLPSGTIHVVGVLQGAFVFMADLVRALPRETCCDFLAVRSYGSATKTSGIVQIAHDLSLPISGEHVLLVEDIVDTGLTLRHLQQLLATRGPASLHTCALLNKPSRRRVEVPVDFIGFEIPDHFVVGYGLDFDQRYRNLPYIGSIEAAQA
jgi:hypoxanthine phosphoribosyltransferase